MLAVAMMMASVHVMGQKVHVKFFTPGIVRVTKTPDNNSVERKSLVVTASPRM